MVASSAKITPTHPENYNRGSLRGPRGATIEVPIPPTRESATATLTAMTQKENDPSKIPQILKGMPSAQARFLQKQTQAEEAKQLEMITGPLFAEYGAAAAQALREKDFAAILQMIEHLTGKPGLNFIEFQIKK